MDDDAAFEAFRHRATLGAGAVKGEGFGGRRMQPLRLAADAQARLVEAAHARGADEGADLLGDRRKRRPRPFRHAGGAKAIGAGEIGERLGRSILGNQLPGMEIAPPPEGDRHIGQARHAFGKSRPGRLAATGAGINQTPMLGDLDQPLRQIEHPTPHAARRLATAEGRPAMAAGRGLMGHDPVRLGGLGAGSRPCGLSARRPVDPTAREGSPASPGGHRSTAAWNSSNCSSQGAARSSAFSARNASNSR